MKILFKILALLLIWNVSLFCQKNTQTAYHHECGYRVISGSMFFEIDSIAANYFKDYKAFKIELADSVNYWLKANMENGYYLVYPYDKKDKIWNPDEIRAVDIYEFTEDSSFVVIRFWNYGLSSYFIGLCTNLNRWFPLSDIDGNEIEKNFNKILKLCPSLNNKSLICKSALLLGLKYETAENSILYKLDDIAGILAFGWSQENRPPDSLDIPRSLYKLKISSDTVLNGYFNWERFEAYIKATENLKEELSIIPPRVIHAESQDTVELTIYNSYFGEIAEWRIVYDKSGLIESMDYIRKPILTYYRQMEAGISQPRFRKFESVDDNE